MTDRSVVVRLGANITHFVRAMNEAAKAAENTTKTTTKAWKNIGTATKTTAKIAGNALNTITAVGTALAVTTMKAGIDYNALQQNTRSALETLLGSAQAAEAQMQRMDKFASTSPFGKDALLKAQQQLIGFGVEAEKVIPILGAVQDATVATGGSSQQMSEIVYVLAQISSAGKVTATDLMQLGQRGVNAAELVGSQMGKTGAQVRQMITDGKISADDFVNYLTKGMQQAYGGAAAGLKKQLAGALDRVKAARRDIGAMLAEPLVDPKGGGALVEWANQVADVLRAIGAKVKAFSPEMKKAFTEWSAPVSEALKNLRANIEAIGVEDISSAFKTVAQYKAPIAGVAASLSAMATQSGPLAALGLSINPVVAGLGAMALASDPVRNAFANVLESSEPLKRSLSQLVLTGMELINRVLSAAAPGLQSMSEAAVKVATAFSQMLVALSPLVEVILVPLVRLVSALAGALSGLSGPALAAGMVMLALKGHMGGLVKVSRHVTDAMLSVATTFRDAYDSGLKFWGAAKLTMSTGISKGMGKIAGAAKSAGAALLGAFGGPMGLTISGGIAIATAAISSYAAKQAELRQKTEELKVAFSNSSGAVDAQVESLVRNQIGVDDLTQASRLLGVTQNELVRAIAEGGPKADAYIKQLNATKGATEGATNANLEAALAMDGMTPAQQKQIKATLVQANTYSDLAGRLQEIKNRTNEAQEAIPPEEKARRSAAQAAREQAAAIEAANNAREKEARSARARIDAVYAEADAMEKAKELFASGSAIAFDSSGTVDILGSNRNQLTVLQDIAKAQEQNLNVMREQKKSQAEINAQIGEYNAKWQAMADTYGWSAQQLEQIKKTVGYIGEMESPVIKIDADASNAVDQVHQFLSFVKENKDGQITINANDDPAMEALAVALNAVRQADGTFTINANDDPAMAELLAYTSEVNMSDGTVKLLANSDNADKKLTDVISDINSSEGILAILGNKDPTTVTLGEVVAEINARRDAMLQIQGDNKHALAAVNAVVQYARNNPATQILDIFTNKHETTFTRKVNLDGNDIPVASKNKRTYWTGGYTGPGNMYHPAGIVHAGEYVVPKRVVDRTGPRYWDELVASMPGYASGGFVSQIASTPPPPQPLIALDFPSTFTLVGGEISGTIGVDGRLVDGRISGALQARDRARRLAQR